MNKQQLLVATRDTLAKSGFYTSPLHNLRSVCFDLVARRDNTLLIVKVLGNIDALSKNDATELKVLATSLSASPLVIGTHCKNQKLETGIVYTRFGVTIISKMTLDEFILEGVPPFVFAAPGGLFVKLDNELVKKYREQNNLSLGALAEACGVSRKAVMMYEDGMGASLEVATKLEQLMGEGIIVALDPFSNKKNEKNETKNPKENEPGYPGTNRFEKEVFNQLTCIGYSVIHTAKCPFEALASDKKAVILAGMGPNEEIAYRAGVTRIISRVAESHSLFILEKTSKENINGSPVIARSEFKKINSPEQIIEIILERERESS